MTKQLKKIKIEDNFLPQEAFNNIQSSLGPNNFPWFFSDNIDYVSDVDKFQFIHLFYDASAPTSDKLQILSPIIDVLDPFVLGRIKANLLTKTPSIVENSFHIDLINISEEKIKQWTTSIFYVNTNNGYTKFEDGSVVESVANRMVTFPANMKHTGTSCTDEKIRIIINFNYFTRDK